MTIKTIVLTGAVVGFAWWLHTRKGKGQIGEFTLTNGKCHYATFWDDGTVTSVRMPNMLCSLVDEGLARELAQAEEAADAGDATGVGNDEPATSNPIFDWAAGW